MSEFAPIARSPITSPSAAQRSSIVRDDRQRSDPASRAALKIADCTPLAKITLRASVDSAAARELVTDHGRARREVGGPLVVGSSPGEWTLIGEAAAARARRACDIDPGDFTSTIDQTHGRALIRLTGGRAKDLLAKVCGIDLDDGVTPNGSAFRSSVAKLVTDVAREDVGATPSYWLHCERSSGQYLFDALFDAGAEFDIAFDDHANEDEGSGSESSAAS